MFQAVQCSLAWGDLLITFVICWRPPLSAPETLMQRSSNYPSPPPPNTTSSELDIPAAFGPTHPNFLLFLSF